jgi:nucleotide-binding universal stress UspA family protein
VPTVVVPDTWDATASVERSILAALDIHHDADAVLEFAFTRAQELGVPVVALHVWDTHPALVPDAEDLRRWGGEARDAVEVAIGPWKRKFPDVEARGMQLHARPAEGILAESEAAQLVVLGRHSRGRSPAGLGLRSVTRSVMHLTDVPVAVVPTLVER